MSGSFGFRAEADRRIISRLGHSAAPADGTGSGRQPRSAVRGDGGRRGGRRARQQPASIRRRRDPCVGRTGGVQTGACRSWRAASREPRTARLEYRDGPARRDDAARAARSWGTHVRRERHRNAGGSIERSFLFEAGVEPQSLFAGCFIPPSGPCMMEGRVSRPRTQVLSRDLVQSPTSTGASIPPQGGFWMDRRVLLAGVGGLAAWTALRPPASAVAGGQDAHRALARDVGRERRGGRPAGARRSTRASPRSSWRRCSRAPIPRR